MTEAEIEQQEYERLEYIRTYFVPAYENCSRGGGFVVYDGPMSVKMKYILDKQDWEQLSRTDIIHFKCSK